MTMKELQEMPKPARVPASVLADMLNPLYPNSTLRRDGMVEVVAGEDGGMLFLYEARQHD